MQAWIAVVLFLLSGGAFIRSLRRIGRSANRGFDILRTVLLGLVALACGIYGFLILIFLAAI